MPLANYSTTVEAAKSINEIQVNLAKHGAREILMNYAKDGILESLSFIIETPHGNIPFRLPVDADAVLKVLERQHREGKLRQSHMGRPTREQSVRVAWRIARDWLRAQTAMLEYEMVRIEQIFLPYMITPNGKTLYEGMVEKGFYLGEGKPE